MLQVLVSQVLTEHEGWLVAEEARRVVEVEGETGQRIGAKAL